MPAKRKVKSGKMDARKTREPVSNHPTPTLATEAETAATQAMNEALDEVHLTPPQPPTFDTPPPEIPSRASSPSPQTSMAPDNTTQPTYELTPEGADSPGAAIPRCPSRTPSPPPPGTDDPYQSDSSDDSSDLPTVAQNTRWAVLLLADAITVQATALPPMLDSAAVLRKSCWCLRELASAVGSPITRDDSMYTTTGASNFDISL